MTTRREAAEAAQTSCLEVIGHQKLRGSNGGLSWTEVFLQSNLRIILSISQAMRHMERLNQEFALLFFIKKIFNEEKIIMLH